MGAMVLQDNIPFLGKIRNHGDVISDDELGHVTEQTKAALVSAGVLDIEGYHAAGAPAGGGALSMDDRERLGRIEASLERLHEKVDRQSAKSRKTAAKA